MLSSIILLGALLAQSGECPLTLQQARTSYEARKFDAAAAEFERAVATCSDSTRILLPLAQAQLMAQHLEASLQTLNRLLDVEPKNTDALKLKGDVLYLTGKEPEAENALLAALDVDRGHAASRYALSRIYYQQSRFAEAADGYRKLIEQDPNHFRAHDNLALCYAALHQDADALRHFLKALDLVHKNHPEYDTVYANAANFFLDREQYQKAFQLAAEAAQRNPASARNFFLTGKALVKLEKHDISVKWFKQAAELDTTYAEPRYWLAQVYRKLGQTADADRELEAFRELSKQPKRKR